MEEHATAPIEHKTDWSPYPALIGVSAPLLAVAAVLRSAPLLALGVFLVGVAVGGWLREAGREHEAGRGTEEHEEGEDLLQRASRQTLLAALALVPLLALWVATARMLVAHDLLVGRALVEAAAPAGPQLPVAMTLVLLLAPVTAQLAAAWRRSPSKPRLILGTGLTTLLGLAFLALLVAFWARLVGGGVVPSASPAASALYWTSGLAGAQVAVAALFSGVIATRATLGVSPTGHRHAEAVTIVWAFVALAWIATLALLLYL